MAIMAQAVWTDGTISSSQSRKYNRANSSLASEQVDEWNDLMTRFDNGEDTITVSYDNHGNPIMIDRYIAQVQLELWELKRDE